MTDGFGRFIAIIFIGLFCFGAGAFFASSVMNSNWQRLMIEDYGATYCDGIFSLTPCKK